MIVGVSGKLGSGKNAAHESMMLLGGTKWENVKQKAFAHKIKEIVATLTNTTVDVQYSEEGKLQSIFKLANFAYEHRAVRDLKILKVVALMTDTTMAEQQGSNIHSKISKIHNKSFAELQDDILDYYLKYLSGGLLPDKYATCGGLQQHLGMIHREKYGGCIWVNTLFWNFDPSRDNWVITDLRFPEEVDVILKNGGFLIRMEGDPKGVRARSTRDPNHPSETALDSYKGWHAVIDNAKDDLENLHTQIANFVCKYNIAPI